MTTWKQTLEEIRRFKIQLASFEPGAGPAVSPREGAPLRTISIAERRLGRRLPPSYRAFLHAFDGWPLFCHGASLLGTTEITNPRYAALAQAAFAAYETPIPELGPPSRPEGRTDAMIAFGIDPEADAIFAFNPGVVRPDGEQEVITWVNGIGERYESFAEFLGAVRDMLASEAAEFEQLLRKTA